MPNWCVGELKIRGKRDDVVKFLKSSLSEGEITITPYQDVQLTDVCGHIKGTYRCFISERYTQDFMVINDSVIVVIHVEHAWSPKLEEFRKLSKEFCVDFRFYGYECGAEFNCEFEIIKGEVTLKKVIEFENYQWECPHPMLGG